MSNDLDLRINGERLRHSRAYIVDNFYHNPHDIRRFALAQEYFDDEGYIGRRTRQQFLFEGIKESFEEIMGKKITKWQDYGMNGRFQHNYAGEKLVYHCDAQKYAAMIYLTPDAPPQCGTSTYVHRETGVYHNSQLNWDEGGNASKVFPGKTFLDKTPYDTVDSFGNIFNRLVIFDGGLIHAASEYFGSELDDCRLWHMFFFDAE